MRIGHLIRLHRTLCGLGVRRMAKELGVSPATLSRIERGKECDSRTLMKLINWMTEEQK